MRPSTIPGPATVAERAYVEAGSLRSAAGVAELFDRYPVYRDGLQWLQQFVIRAHPDLGRSGAVCPRLIPALRADTVWFVALGVSGASPQHAISAGHLLRELFDDLATGGHRSSSALLGFFPHLSAEHAAEFIDGGHRLLRPGFVEQGLMLGEFHPRSTVGSVHNSALPVMRCPAPMFAVRAMTPHDVLFLDQPHLPPPERLTSLRHFGTHVGPRLGAAGRADLHARIAAVRALSEGDSW